MDEMILLTIFLAAIIICYAVSVICYKKTSYYDITHNSYLSVKLDKGRYGEFLIYKYLKKYENDGAKFLFNCYLPKNDTETTEIDVIMIHSSGIYIFESKNYSGWIFGSENQKNWTQTLPSGKKVKKEHFFNPVIQNKLHIKCLAKQIGDNMPFYSVIVFSERCELKKTDVYTSNVYVVKRNIINRTVHEIKRKNVNYLLESEINEIYAKLYPFTQVTKHVKEKHIQDIQKNV